MGHCAGHMPKEALGKDKPRTKWEGTHLYSRTSFQGQRRRTVAQVREDFALAKGEREKSKLTPNRRNSLPTPTTTRRTLPVAANNNEDNAVQEIEIDEVFFDASAEAEEICPDRGTDGGEEGNMPGSNKKKRNASGGARPPDNVNNPTGEGIDPCLKGFLLSIKEELQASTKAAAEQVAERMDKRIAQSEKNIQELKERLDARDREIDAKIATGIARMGTTKNSAGARRSAGSSRREEAYHYCRRSLKLWPVQGDDLEDEVRVFMKNHLQLQDARIRSVGVIEVTPSTGRAAKDRREVLATFETKEDRDMVKAAGVNLAGKKEIGMSIHVPGHLLDNYFALNAVGYNIKSKHAGVRRAVKFDDLAQDVYLDIYVGEQWKKITPDQARLVQSKLPQMANLTSSLTADDLTDLVQGNPVAGLTAVVVPSDYSDK